MGLDCRNGIGINEQANIELPGLKGMWSLRGSEESPYDSYLVVSFISETKVLASAGTALSNGLFASAEHSYRF